MRVLAFLLLINVILVTCHKVSKREIDEEGYDWEAGVPHYEHFHYNEEDEIDFAPRIIGGQPSWHGEFPAKISVQTREGNHFCGGALIDLRHILTAAHCLTTNFGAVFEPERIRLMGDDVSIQRHGAATRQVRFASHIFVHPSFNIDTYGSDIAVIRVSQSFQQTGTLRAFPRSFSTPPDGVNCNLAGWGTTAEVNTRPHPILLRVELQMINLDFCNGSLSFHGAIPHGTFCAGSLDGSRDACFGDSGGGLMCSGQIAGIVSFGFGCGRRNFPGAYVDVSQFNHWIQESLAWDGPNQEIPRPPVVLNPNSVAKLFVSAKLIAAVVIAVNVFAH